MRDLVELDAVGIGELGPVRGLGVWVGVDTHTGRVEQTGLFPRNVFEAAFVDGQPTDAAAFPRSGLKRESWQYSVRMNVSGAVVPVCPTWAEPSCERLPTMIVL
jgi:hypothetical protein